MALAIAQATEAALAGEVPVGAVVVRNGEVVAYGRNRTIEWNDPSAHAEVVALREAAKIIGSHRMAGLALYVTLEPCAMCSGAIFQSRLDRVIFGATEPKTGCAGSIVDLFAFKKLNHHTKIRGGVLAAECGALLQDFFDSSRKRNQSLRAPLREDALRTPESALLAQQSSVFRGEYIYSLEGHRIHYVDLNRTQQSKSVLCLHDLPYSGMQFDPWTSGLIDAGFRVIVPDLVGCGLSDKPKKSSWHTAQNHAAALRDLMANLKFTPTHVVAIGSSISIASHLLENAWRNTRMLPLQFAVQQTSEAGEPKKSDPNVTGFWKSVDRHILMGLEEQLLRSVKAPFPDRGYASILEGMKHTTFLKPLRNFRPTVVGSNLYELEPEILEFVLAATEA
nr:tRNA adenosine(34) deaminase TadA [uncultured Rhodoferax sp.]